MFRFKHPNSKKYEPIEASDPDQIIKAAVDNSLSLLGLPAIEWNHRELHQETVSGSDPSTMKRERISIYFKCSTVFNKCLSTRHSTEPVTHVHPIKQELRHSVPMNTTSTEPGIKQSNGHPSTTGPSPLSDIPMLETTPTFHSHTHLNSLSSEQKQQPGYSHYHHHQTDSNNFKIDGSHNVAANTAGDGSIIGQDVKDNSMQNVDKSYNTWRDCTITPLTNMSSATTADGRQALKPTVDITPDISDAINEYKEAYLRDVDTTLNALDFVTILNQRMLSVVHLDNIAYIDTSTIGSNQDLNLLYDDIKTWSTCGVATGFIVSPNLLLTNWHVFPTISFAKFALARVVFDYNQANSARKEGKLNPEVFYWSDRSLDCCLIAFSGANGDTIVRNPIIISSENVEPLLNRDNRLTIIQHPEGKPMRLSLDGCTVKGQNIDKGFIVYTNDTAGGSSGSPVFSRTWILVALHHAAVRLSTLTSSTSSTTVKKRRLSGLTEKGEVLNQGTLISIIYQALLAHLQDMKSQVHTTPTVAPKITLLQDLLLQDPKITSKIRKEIKP